MIKKYNVFYSWASESINGDKIEKAILSVIDELNRDYSDDYVFELIKAIRDDDPGSPNISQKIRDRIRNSDMFIGDVTPFYKGRRKWFFTRPLIAIPNPNVTFEYGFAEAYLGEDRCILFEDNAMLSEKTKHTNRPFDIQQYNRITVHGDDFSDTKQTIKNEIVKIVNRKPQISKVGVINETQYDISLVNKLFKEEKLDEIVCMIENSVDTRRHELGYCSRINNVMLFLESENKFFDGELEASRLQVYNSLSELRAWEVENFNSDPHVGCSDLIIDPPNLLYSGCDYNKAQKDYYDKIYYYASLWKSLDSSVKHLKEKTREKLHIIF